jgi:hypothetical protein
MVDPDRNRTKPSELGATPFGHSIERGSRGFRFLIVGLWMRAERLSEPIRRIVSGYLIVALFLAVLFVLATFRSKRSSSLFDDVTLVLFLSLVVVLPLAIEFLRPIVSTVKVGVLEVSFRKVAERSEAVSENLEQAGRDWGTMIESMAISYYSNILTKLGEINERKAEVAKVNLGSGTSLTWKYPNLYFLALLLELQSGVRDVLFVYLGDDGIERYLTMCAPGALRKRLGEVSAPLEMAATKWKAAQADLAPKQSPGNAFSAAINEARMASSKPTDATTASVPSELLDEWVKPNDLLNLMGLDLNLCRIEWKDRLSRYDYKALLSCSHSHIAVTQDGHLVSILDQHKVALAVARNST